MATTGPSVQIDGVDRLFRTLGDATKNLDDLDRATEQTATIIAAGARARAPRRSGRLASSITTGTGPNQAMIGSDVVYASPIHWGWRTRGIDPNRFVYDTAEETQTQWLDVWRDDVQKTLDDVKGA